jgi:hypothetical protein
VAFATHDADLFAGQRFDSTECCDAHDFTHHCLIAGTDVAIGLSQARKKGAKVPDKDEP